MIEITNQKKEFFKKFNEAFMTGDIDFILDSVTDDVKWTMIGDDTIVGKDALQEALRGMKSNNDFELTISHNITHGTEAAVNGTIKMTNDGEEKVYGFCDVYKLNKHQNGKIKELISYVIEM